MGHVADRQRDLITRTGGQWRMMLKDLPPWQTVYGYFRRWTRQCLWPVSMRRWWSVCERNLAEAPAECGGDR